MLVCLRRLRVEDREWGEGVDGPLTTWDQRGGLPLQLSRQRVNEDVLLLTSTANLRADYT
jgi:hypothetical protein